MIADLTNNNPNVHVELGIALMQNKNILRVTGRSLSEVGFDIRQLELRPYGDEETLLSRNESRCVSRKDPTNEKRSQETLEAK